MKRISSVLLFVLLILPATAGAAAQQRPKKKTVAKPGKPIAATAAKPERKQVAALDGDGGEIESGSGIPPSGPVRVGPPVDRQLNRASGKRFDLRLLPQTPPEKLERPEREEPQINRGTVQGHDLPPETVSSFAFRPKTNAPAPPPNMNFDGLDFATFGNGHPPDTVGDVGPTYYIQAINTSLAVFRKSDGARLAAFSFNTFMSQGAFGNLCDTNNFGDPVILYDSFEDRWIITDFAFQLSGGAVVNPPGNFQCFAVSMNGDPISGGWNFYSINTANGLGDYPKFGVWSDGLYMTTNLFAYMSQGTFLTARAYAFNKAQMYAGTPTVQVVTFDIPGGDFTVLPSNARLQSGTPPPGTPNYFVSTWIFLNALTVYKFHVDWARPANSTFTGPDIPIAATSWPNATVPNAPSLGGNALDVLQIRAMMQNQYSNIGGAESLWTTHTVRRANTTGFAAPRWYQLDVTGGTVNANITQAATWDPDGANVMYRFMPSLAIDRAGDMALGYSTSSSTTKPAIKYAGRVPADPINTLGQTEQLLIQGTGTQTGNCGGAPCTRWGDYSAMSLDPDGCTFWYTNMYYAVDGLNHLTRIGSFGPFPGCAPFGAGGTLTGTVTSNPGGTPLSGATLRLGTKSTTTNGSGVYTFSNLPAGSYTSLTASLPGFVTGSASPVVVSDGGTTTQNFSLTSSATNNCYTDTTTADFQTGVQTNTDITTTADAVILVKPFSDQQNLNYTGSGVGFNTATWNGQSFTPAVSGQLFKADLALFCSGCTGTTPNLTVSVRATTTGTPAGVPTGADLTTGTLTGFSSGAVAFYTVTFAPPLPVTAGTTYAVLVRPTVNPSAGLYAAIRSVLNTGVGVDVYSGGARLSGATSGTVWTISTAGGVSYDTGFRAYIDRGYAATGDQVSNVLDANAAGNLTAIWSTLSWNASTPANTSVKFQVAASNSANGPFNFVGPDGTAGTSFTTSPVQLSPQFYNFRYLKYKAILGTTDSTVTPTVNDVTVCFNDVDCSSTVATIVPTPASVCSNSTGNTAAAPPGMTSYAWGITNGTITSATNIQTITYTAGASGTVTLNVTITAPNGCIASGSQPVTINPLPPKPTISGTLSFCTGGNTTLSSSAPGGNQWYLGPNPIAGETNQTLLVTAAGSYTVQVTDPNGCVSPMSDPAVVTQNSPPPTPTINADTNGTGTQDQACPEVPLTLHANGATGAVSYQWYKDIDLLNGETNATYQATGAATYYVTATDANGCTTPQSAGYVVQNPTPHSPFVSFRGQDSSVTTLHICQGSSQIIDSDSATGIHWWKDGVDLGPGSQSLTVSVGGVYTAQLNALGCHSQFGRNVTLIIDTMPPTPTISGDTNGTGTQDQACPEQPLTLHANGATGATSYTWYSDNAIIPGETTSTLVMTGVGNISVTATNGTCTTPHSATYVVQNPTPHSPFVSIRTQPSTTTSIAFCQGGSIILDSDSATGIHWWKDGVDLGPGSQSLTVTQSGVYTAQLNALGCHSQFGRNITVTVNPLPPTPTITPGGPTTFCAGGSVLLSSSAGSGNQWKLNGSPIGGANGTTYSATASGSYTVTVTDGNGCSSTSAATVVTVNPLPPTPTVTPGGPTTFCQGGSVTLTSSAASGNQWLLNGAPIGGATNTTYVASVAGDYAVRVTDGNGCTSANSAVTTVNVNPNPNATITAPASVNSGTTNNPASVANAGAGATYNWSATNGAITSGNNTPNVTFSAGAVGSMSLQVTVTTAAGCSDTKSANVTVNTSPVSITSVVPPAGKTTGGKPVTINGTGFLAGATVTFGGNAATSVVVVNSTKITAVTPAHAAGFVNVTVTNTNTTTGTLVNGYKYVSQQFDANNDNTIDPADIFYLVNYLFLNGNPPIGPSGMLSGDANGDNAVDPSDIFYVINYLFMSGPAPASEPSRNVSGQSVAQPFSGSVTLGQPFERDGRTVIPVSVASRPGAEIPQALSLRVVFSGAPAGQASIHRAGDARGMEPGFEISRRTANSLVYLLSFEASKGRLAGLVAEIELEARPNGKLSVDVDPALTLLSNQAGTRRATVAAGTLSVSGTSIDAREPLRSKRNSE